MGKIFEALEKSEKRKQTGSVKKDEIAIIKGHIQLIELNSSTKIPFENDYSTPNTLGVDRIGLVAGAVSMFPNKNVLIIDAGTCITYDFVDSNSHYKGGSISPGIQIRYRSLPQFTKNLPLLHPNFDVTLIGYSTETCIHSGIINGVLGEVDSIIEKYQKEINQNNWDKVPFILREKGSGTRSKMEDFFKSRNINADSKMELATNEAVKQAIMAGLGASILSNFSMSQEIEDKRIAILKYPGFPFKSHWKLVWLKQKRHSPAVLAFIKWIAENKKEIFKRLLTGKEIFSSRRINLCE